MPSLFSLRPSKGDLESYVLLTRKSTAKEFSAWTVQDDIRLIRAKERDGMDFEDIKKRYFPTRKGIACKKRYNQYLSPNPSDPEIYWEKASVPPSAQNSDATPAAKNGFASALNDMTPSKAPRRPPQGVLETLIISTEKSPATVGDPWTMEDDVRLIRGTEVQMFGWQRLREIFPGRNRNELENRCRLLAKPKDAPNLDVSPEIFGGLWKKVITSHALVSSVSESSFGHLSKFSNIEQQLEAEQQQISSIAAVKQAKSDILMTTKPRKAPSSINVEKPKPAISQNSKETTLNLNPIRRKHSFDLAEDSNKNDNPPLKRVRNSVTLKEANETTLNPNPIQANDAANLAEDSDSDDDPPFKRVRNPSHQKVEPVIKIGQATQFRDDTIKHSRPIESCRPSNHVLESLEITTDVSSSRYASKWTLEDDVRLIRARECFEDVIWSEITALFPARNRAGVKARYHNGLLPSKDRNPISVPTNLLFGSDISQIVKGAQVNQPTDTICETEISNATIARPRRAAGQPPGDPTPPNFFVIFRESSSPKDSDDRFIHFRDRAQKLARTYQNHVNDDSVIDSHVPWALIKSKASNTDFTNSNDSGVKILRQWLRDLHDEISLRRVVLILSQVDGFSTNAASLKTVFTFCKKLDIWLFFVHGPDRRSLLHFQTLQALIIKTEQGIRPIQLLKDYPEAEEYLITLIFMSGAGINKRNISKNLQAQKQLQIGNRNHFDLGFDGSSTGGDRPFMCPYEECGSKFKSLTTLRSHVKKDHVEGEEIDEFTLALGLQPGMPVTPEEIRLLLFPSLLHSPLQTLVKVSPKLLLPGASADSKAILYTTPLVQPTTYRSKEDRTRVASRPSDDLIANHVIRHPPSKSGEDYTLEDDIRLIRLKEIDRLQWSDIQEQFPGRTQGSICARYNRKLLKAVEDFRPTLNTMRQVTESTSRQKRYAPEEDLIIIKAKENDGLEWEDIAKLLPGRSHKSAHGRYWHFLRKPDDLQKNEEKEKEQKKDLRPSPQEKTQSSSRLPRRSTTRMIGRKP